MIDNDNEVEPLESSEDNVLSADSIKNKLIALGVNSTYGSYDDDQRSLLERFFNLPLAEIAPCWMLLKVEIKSKIIDAHEEEFSRFVMGAGNE